MSTRTTQKIRVLREIWSAIHNSISRPREFNLLSFEISSCLRLCVCVGVVTGSIPVAGDQLIPVYLLILIPMTCLLLDIYSACFKEDWSFGDCKGFLLGS